MSLPDPGRLAAVTLDCYGTLIDWESGAVEALRPLLAARRVALADDEIVAAFQELEEPLCEPPYRSYKEVLAGVVEGFGRRFGFPVGAAERGLLAAALPSWRPFPDTVAALRALAGRYKLAVVSNIDDDLFTATARHLGVGFDHVVTAEQARSYKPHPAIFAEAARRLAVDPTAIVHAAEGVTEIPPARRLGCATVWVRRHGRSARLLTEPPDLVVPDMATLARRLSAAG